MQVIINKETKGFEKYQTEILEIKISLSQIISTMEILTNSSFRRRKKLKLESKGDVSEKSNMANKLIIITRTFEIMKHHGKKKNL